MLINDIIHHLEVLYETASTFKVNKLHNAVWSCVCGYHRMSFNVELMHFPTGTWLQCGNSHLV